MANPESYEQKLHDFSNKYQSQNATNQKFVLEEFRLLHHDLLKMKNHVEKKALSLIGLSSLLITGTNIFRLTIDPSTHNVNGSLVRFASISLVTIISITGLLSLACAVRVSSICNIATIEEDDIVIWDELKVANGYYECLLHNDATLKKKSQLLEVSHSSVLICIFTVLLYLVFALMQLL